MPMKSRVYLNSAFLLRAAIGFSRHLTSAGEDAYSFNLYSSVCPISSTYFYLIRGFRFFSQKTSASMSLLLPVSSKNEGNLEVAVTLSIANHHASLPIAYRLYLPKDWADDAERRNKAHVPEAIGFKTKPQIALAQLRAALAAGVARGVVLMDASYGTNSALPASIGALALTYVAAILPTVKVRAVADPDERVSAKALALGLPKHAWRTIIGLDGSADPLRSRFARVRVRA